MVGNAAAPTALLILGSAGVRLLSAACVKPYTGVCMIQVCACSSELAALRQGRTAFDLILLAELSPAAVIAVDGPELEDAVHAGGGCVVLGLQPASTRWWWDQCAAPALRRCCDAGVHFDAAKRSTEICLCEHV